MLTRFSLMPAEWHALPHSRRGILEKQYSFLVCLSMTSWWCFLHSLPLRDSDPERMAMEEDMPPVGLPKNLTHLSDSLSSCSFRWLGRGLQVLEGRETRWLASSSSGVESRHLRGLGTSASLLLLLSPQRPQSLFFNRLEPTSSAASVVTTTTTSSLMSLAHASACSPHPSLSLPATVSPFPPTLAAPFPATLRSSSRGNLRGVSGFMASPQVACLLPFLSCPGPSPSAVVSA